MIKSLALMLAAGLLAGCGSTPSATPAAGKPTSQQQKKSCYQADWQAETMPVINKRIGNERLEKYDAAPNGQEQGCP
jgi:ABC-type glycerol-3-phosphate transport system substrate-binding protein